MMFEFSNHKESWLIQTKEPNVPSVTGRTQQSYYDYIIYVVFIFIFTLGNWQ